MPTHDERGRTIEDLRRAIDAVDARLLELLNERGRLAVEVGKRKEQMEATPFVPSRERQVLDRLTARNPGPLSGASLIGIYHEIIAACRLLQKPLVVSYLGPPGTFTQMAAVKKFGAGAQLTPADSVDEVFGEVEKSRADYGVVPIENSTEGVENHTLDTFAVSRLRICAECYVEADHGLLASERRAGYDRIYSHRQALAQCRGWIRRQQPKAELVEVSSTSRAAEMAAKEPSAAAIGTELAATLYGLQVIESHIQDNPHNRTRFLVIGTTENPPSGRDKTSLMFSVRHQAGALFRALGIFDEFSINLTLIESRPTKQTPWEYVFFADLQGHAHDPRVADALRRLEEQALFVRLLGSYPEAE
jgi:chorismate mutase/prephenate dehydratase